MYSSRVAVKLGEETINRGFIAEAPFRRGIQAIETFKQKCEEYGTTKFLAFATSAIRDASNGEAFVKEIRDKLDIEIDVIDGNREAELIYYGIREAVALGDEVSLIMDIGGGSNEFILANDKQIFWKQSFNIGAARLLEKFKHSDPITNAEINEINAYLKQELLPLFDAVKKVVPAGLVGSSGAFESIIEMIHGEFNGEPLTSDKTEYEPSLAMHFKISDLVKNSTLEERKKINGLLPIRFDMIVISCIMIDFILRSFQLKKMRISTYSLKEGALAEYITKLEQ